MAEQRVLFSAQKNEGPFLLEWVAYHVVLGFDRIIIFSNDCDDGSDALLDAMAAKGLIEHYENRIFEGMAPQHSAIRHALEMKLFRNGDYVAYWDIDEFLLPTPGNRKLDDLFAARDFAAIAVPWRMMGDSGNDTFPGRHISPAFTMGADPPPERRLATKSMFRFGPEIVGFGVHRPIFAEGTKRKTYPYIFGDGEDVPLRYFKGGDGHNNSPTHEGIADKYKLAQLIHFSVRTPEMFALKGKRGDGHFVGDAVPKRDDARYERHNRNDAPFTDHLIHEAETVALMDDWLTDPKIAAAANAIPGFKVMPMTKTKTKAKAKTTTKKTTKTAAKTTKATAKTTKAPANPSRPEPKDDFGRLIAALAPEDAVRICDVGANPLDAEASYQGFLTHGVGHVVGFEPQPEALARLLEAKSDAETYLPNAVGTGEDMQLHIFRSPGLASKYPADPGTVETLYRFDIMTRDKGQISMPTSRLDDLDEVPPIDVLKIDVQGSEYDIIRNGREKLKDAMVVHTEVRFFPMYEGEPDFAELHAELVAQGFLLHSFLNNKTHLLKSGYEQQFKPRMATQLLDGDAIYVRDIRKTDDWTDRQLQVAALFMLLSFPAPDLATFLMAKLRDRGALDAALVDAYVQTLVGG